MSASLRQSLAPLIKAPRKSVLVIAPMSIIDDELRMARLEEYLQAEFPDLRFIMAPENTLPGNQSAVEVMLEKDGTNSFTKEETENVTDNVLSAMTAFVDHRVRKH